VGVSITQRDDARAKNTPREPVWPTRREGMLSEEAAVRAPNDASPSESNRNELEGAGTG